MKADAKELAKGQIELTIEISPEEMRPFLDKAARIISEGTKIEGFRPGKAPYDIVKSKVGEGAIWEEALHGAVSRTYFDAITEKKLETVGQPKIEVQKMAPGNPLVYKATVALLPEVRLPDYKNMKVKREAVKIDDKKVGEALEELRRMRRKETDADKTVEKGDKAQVDWDMTLDNVAVEGGQARKADVFVDDNFYIPGFVDNLVGLRKGDEKKFRQKFPKDYFNKNLAGRTVDFKIKVGQVFKIELPELDDEFAKSLGKFKGLAELRAELKKNLEEEDRQRKEQKAELKMLEDLADKTEFGEIPDVLTESEAHKMVHELEDNILGQGLKFDDYLAHIKKTEKDLEKEMAPRAEKRVKTSLIIREVARQEKIEVASEEIDRQISQSLEAYKDQEEIRDKLNSEAYREYLESVLTNRKVIEFLKDAIIE